MNSEPVELYRKHRPKRFQDILGQSDVLRPLVKKAVNGDFPHALLLSGPSGTGKTTVARLLKRQLECSDVDYCEINAAESRGIDTIRDIQQRMVLAPLGGKCRIWCIDECHRQTTDSQSALLKSLEDTPSHVYFFLATTEPQKLLATIRTRCMEIRLKPLSNDDLTKLIMDIARKENKPLEKEVVERISEVSDGSARKALVLLHQVVDLASMEEQLEIVRSSEIGRKAIELARGLMNPKTNWSEIKSILEGIDEDPESLRRMVLGYAGKVVLGGGKMAARAFLILTAFEGNFYDSGRAGLIRACWESFPKNS